MKNEDSQANNIAFHSQFESGIKTSTNINSVVLTNNEDVEPDKEKKDDYDKLEKNYNLLHATWKELNQDYIVIKTKNVTPLEENSHIKCLV